MKPIHETLYNKGERLIPFISHDVMEFQRHYSSYIFFKDVILKDIKAKECISETINILELGFGIGYGTKMLSQIPGTRIVAVDNSLDCQKYAQEKFGADNIEYCVEDIIEVLAKKEKFDYIISRGVMEHVPDGINAIMRDAKFTHRLLFDVPYNENIEANEHHLVTRITEDNFAAFEGYEFLYEDLRGEIFNAEQKPSHSNLIMCVCSTAGMTPLTQKFSFPIKPRLPAFSNLRYFINMTANGDFKDAMMMVLPKVKQAIKKPLRALRKKATA